MTSLTCLESVLPRGEHLSVMCSLWGRTKRSWFELGLNKRPSHKAGTSPTCCTCKELLWWFGTVQIKLKSPWPAFHMNKSSGVRWPESAVQPDLPALHIRKRQMQLQAIQPPHPTPPHYMCHTTACIFTFKKSPNLMQLKCIWRKTK